MRHMPSTNEAIRSGSRSFPARRRSSVDQEHLLHEVRRRLPVAQVAQAVEAHARREAPVELCLGCRIGRGAGPGDAPGERGVELHAL